jgi:hypothetical protein
MKVRETVKGLDSFNLTAVFERSVQEILNNIEVSKHIAAYTRRFSDNAEIESKAIGGWFLVANIADRVHVAGIVFRGLVLFVRIASKIFGRDYILGRFLQAREELILKSAICREIELDSKI